MPNSGFQGSLNFVSASVMAGHNSGRKDDLIAVCYLIYYLVDDFLFSRISPSRDFEDKFNDVLLLKSKTSPEDMC